MKKWGPLAASHRFARPWGMASSLDIMMTRWASWEIGAYPDAGYGGDVGRNTARSSSRPRSEVRGPRCQTCQPGVVLSLPNHSS